jgi:hypothetical protein
MNRDTLISVRDAMLDAERNTILFFRHLAHRSQLAAIDGRDRTILDGLKTDGAYATNLDALGASGTAGLVTATDRLFDEVSRLSPEKGNKDYMIGAQPDLITNYPDIRRFE